MATFPNSAPSVGGQGLILDGVLTVARPVGALVYDTATGGIYRSTNAAAATYEAVAIDATIAAQSVTLDSSPKAVTIAGVAATDLVFVSFVSDDTGGALTKILGVATLNTVTLTSVTALTNNDAVVNIQVVRP